MAKEPDILSVEDEEEIRKIDRRATPGEWVLATSNSFRRVTSEHGRDGDVFFGVTAADGQGDIVGGNVENDLTFACRARTLLPRALRTIEFCRGAAEQVIEQDFELAKLRAELLAADEKIIALKTDIAEKTALLDDIKRNTAKLDDDNAALRAIRNMVASNA